MNKLKKNNNVKVDKIMDKPTAPTIYSYNRVTGEYAPNDKTTSQWSPRENKWLIPASATTIQPPSTGEHEIAVWNFTNKQWEIKANYRDEVWYDTETKERHEIKEIGVTPESTWTQKQPDDDAKVWDNEAQDWVLPFNVLVERKRNEIWSVGDTILAQVKTRFTQAEIESWPKQEQGAKDIEAGNTETDDAKFVSSMAEQRGIQLDTLVAKIMYNVDYYALLSSKVIGEQQRLDDLIKTAEVNQSKEELEAIVWTYNPYEELSL